MAAKVTSLTEMKKTREIVALAPSGNTYKIRPVNLERHALAGGLPSRLRQIALGGAEAINKVFESDTADEDTKEIKTYLDGLVRMVMVDPDLTDVDLDVLPPVDYQWCVNIAMGEEDRDGEGKLLWGREPLSRWSLFRHEHGCPEDCPSCERIRDQFSAALARPVRAVVD